ncbi:cytochrome c oxidase subunit II [Halopseudomonas pelagia]|uniref:cytochrome c oxidase subunit II n=1 Tax=Halopseudomonas pelagia TaxID=553151 RepID=UPI0030DAA85C
MSRRLAATGLLGTPLLLSGCTGPMSSLHPAGPSAQVGAWLWWGMASFFTLVLVAVVLLWLHAMRRDPGQVTEREAQRVQNRWVVGGGLILPTLSIAVILAVGIPLGQRMLPLPPAEGEALRIDVTGHQWWWEVSYPDTGIVLQDALHIPAGVPVDLYLTSSDVIHAFWVPRLGGKMDMFPGRTNVLRLEADHPGIYHGSCSEFCGRGHAHMQFTVEAHEPDAYQAWFEEMQADD